MCPVFTLLSEWDLLWARALEGGAGCTGACRRPAGGGRLAEMAVPGRAGGCNIAGTRTRAHKYALASAQLQPGFSPGGGARRSGSEFLRPLENFTDLRAHFSTVLAASVTYLEGTHSRARPGTRRSAVEAARSWDRKGGERKRSFLSLSLSLLRARSSFRHARTQSRKHARTRTHTHTHTHGDFLLRVTLHGANAL